MTRAPSSALASAEPRPVDASERLVLLDALRGFALCGVFLSNAFVWFSGRIFLPQAQADAAAVSASLPDAAANYLFSLLISGKFITLFSFLFGLGFAVQMGRARARGASIAPLYSRRLVVLLGIGLLHFFLLWYGDILATYALLGFGLLLFRGRSDRALLLWAGLCILVLPPLCSVLLRLPELTGSPDAVKALTRETAARSAAIKAETLRALSSGSYLDVVRAGARFYVGEFLGRMPPALLAIFGRFLVGFAVGRHPLFQDVDRYRSLWRRLLGWGLLAGVLGSGAAVVEQQLVLRKLIDAGSMPWLPVWMLVPRQLGDVGFAAVYAASFALLFQRSWGKRLLSVFAPIGRMALSNYLAESAMSLLVYDGCGLGLIGKVGPAECLALTLGLYCLQVGWSHLWLARFRFGPAEWVWRSLTYGRAQPMRRDPAPATAPASI